MMKTNFNLMIIGAFFMLVVSGSVDFGAVFQTAVGLGQTMLLAACGIVFCIVAIAVLLYLWWRQSTADERDADNAELQLQTAQAQQEMAIAKAQTTPEVIAAKLQAELMQLQIDMMRQAAELEYNRLAAQAAIGQAINGGSVVKGALGIPFEQTKRAAAMLPESPQLGIGRLTTLASDLAQFKPQDAPQIRVISGMGGGKSTLLHALTDATNASVLLVQTHEQIHTEDYAGYGKRVEVVGMSPELGDPNAMDTANALACDKIVNMLNVIKVRYAKNIRTPSLLILDEWVDICLWAVQHERDDAITALREMSTSKARKAGVGIVLASQTDRATVSGFKGLADILKQMTEVRLYKDGTGDRWATVKHYGGEVVEYEAAPEHAIVVHQGLRKDAESAAMPRISLADELKAADDWAKEYDAIPDAFDDAFDDDAADEDDGGLTDEQVRAMDVYQDMIDAPGTVSKRQATQAVFGDGKFGANYISALYRVWEGLNLDVSAPQFK